MPQGRQYGVLSHWYHLADGFDTSAQDFYYSVEEALKSRDVPEVTTSRVAWREKGLLSAKREYLRVEREGLVFDIGAAPYGTGYFFSWWMVRLPPQHRVLWTIAMLAVLMAWIVFLGLLDNACLTFAAALLGPPMIIWMLGFLAQKGVFGPEEQIIDIPWIGLIYVLFFQPNLYYRADIAHMFQESVRRAVNEVIETLLSDQGVRALTSDELKPRLRDLAK